ncbi:MAG TPA: MupA/Atu3671 family FMN-dependent luciferase-like monooxygenase [Polyangiaceae bacterium]|nr:MupA/Atu3671 family FMN-dependent luciferase-like monooxygenase [Polyangiaceae bacterium]
MASVAAVDSYPLTPTQHGMLFHAIQFPHSGVDVEQMVATFSHEMDISAFERAWARVMAEHPILHSRYAWEGLATPVQEVVPGLPLRFEFTDVTALPESEQRRTFDERLAADRREGFDFASGPLFRVILFRTKTAEYRCLFSYSHSILDGCVSAVVKEVFATYDAFRRGEEPVFEKRTPYKDHVLWLGKHLAENADAAAGFFRTLLAGFASHTKLAVERQDSSLSEGLGHRHHFFSLGKATSDSLRRLSDAHGLNPPAFVEAAWAVVLGAFSGEDDVVFGFTRECRRSSVPGAAGTIGLFINTVPVRARLSVDDTVLGLVQKMREQQVAVRQHEHTSLVDVLKVADVPRGTPLFESLIVFNGYHNDTLMRSWGGDFEKRTFDFVDQTNFPLNLMAFADEDIHFKLSHDAGRFEESVGARLADAVKIVLQAMAEHPEATLRDLPRFSPSETALVDRWNETGVRYERACIHRLFERQAKRSPAQTALIFRDASCTYAELDARSNVLARRLQADGVGPDVLVGVFVERGIEMMVALLAILKAGGAYVPMDPAYPRDRLAMMLEDAHAPVVVTVPRLVSKLPPHAAKVVKVDLAELALPPGGAAEEAPLESPVGPDDLAYVIFTSGSTGRPKGVMIEHGNVSNFFRGMDERLGADDPGVWLALTSISFDISVLELFWTLTRGFTVVIQESIDETALATAERKTSQNPARMDFSLFYFASDSGRPGSAQYRLLIEGAKFADQNGFTAVWTPERHFHAFGGLYPNPSVTSAALAVLTTRVQLRAGSVVVPLHNPIRCAEEWSVVDNLSNGRVGLSFASGWHASDFAIMPDNFARRRELMWEGIETIRALFRGEAVPAKTGDGRDQTVKMYPPSVQKSPPIWITAGGSPETFTLAGKMGANILTNLLVMKTDDLVKNIQAYRAAYAAAGHPGTGHVTLMLHTFVGDDLEEVRERVRGPFMEYLRTSTDLINKARWEMTAFAQRDKQRAPATESKTDLSDLSPEEMDAMMAHAFDRYFETTGLFGTPTSCLGMIDRLKEMGVSEVACLVDFGVDEDAVLASLSRLAELRTASNPGGAALTVDRSLAAQLRRHSVTHLQCTPSLAAMLASDPEALSGLGGLRKLMLGGEALPTSLLERLAPVLRGDLLNMYGPTETTIWSTTARVDPASGKVTLGRAIANTEVYVVDRSLRALPVGVPGELLIGGDGVARGYLGRPELTRERFVPNPFRTPERGGSRRLYRTGDLVRFLPNGDLEFLGRIDHQLKIRGYRIELGEIESLLTRHPAVAESVVVAQKSESSGDARLVAYVIPAAATRGAPPADGAGQWQTIWNETYRGGGEAPEDAALDIAGWVSSYTGELIPESEMREWVEHTVKRILALAPSRVLEIGCGTGMLLYRVAPSTARYTGIDFSPEALEKIRRELEPRGLSQVELLEKRADQLRELEPGAYDTVVLNSVLQYFPDVQYFVKVVEDVLALLAPGGSFFVGDVRSLSLLEAFHTSIELERAEDGTPAAEIRERVERRVASERELTLAPGLFDALRRKFTDVADVTVQLKPGTADNELTRFRYDVVIRKKKDGEAPRSARGGAPAQSPSLEALAVAMQGGANSGVVRDVLNGRVARDVRAVELLRTTLRDGTAKDVRDALSALPRGESPEFAYRLAAELDVPGAQVTWAASGAVDRFDVGLSRDGVPPAGIGVAGTAGEHWEAYANRPVHAGGGEGLPTELRAYLRERLPEFMVPAAFVVMDAFPLTPNGKIDRKALPEPERAHRASTEAYAAPTTELERKIAAVWQDLLSLDHIGVKDNFFDLGANSFLMVQASTKLRDALGMPVSLVDLFRYTSVGALAARLGDSGAEGAAAKEGQERAQARKDAMARRRDARARAR